MLLLLFWAQVYKRRNIKQEWASEENIFEKAAGKLYSICPPVEAGRRMDAATTKWSKAQKYCSSTAQWLPLNRMHVLEWSSHISGLNPIPMQWHDLIRPIHTRHPKNIAKLKQFGKIPPDSCVRVIYNYKKLWMKFHLSMSIWVSLMEIRSHSRTNLCIKTSLFLNTVHIHKRGRTRPTENLSIWGGTNHRRYIRKRHGGKGFHHSTQHEKTVAHVFQQFGSHFHHVLDIWEDCI